MNSADELQQITKTLYGAKGIEEGVALSLFLH
jgi:hypothetical protein